MKANELMIGDWVNLRVEEDNFSDNISVTSTDLGNHYILKHIEPIPLTPAILEKNGFHEWIGDDCEWRYERKYWCTGIYIVVSKNEPCEEAGIRISIDFGENKWGAWHALNLYNKNYVHELQHALRLCGIYEEIIL